MNSMKNTAKKLVLNKETVSNLGTLDMTALKGGLARMAGGTSPKCALTAWDGCEDNY